MSHEACFTRATGTFKIIFGQIANIEVATEKNNDGVKLLQQGRFFDAQFQLKDAVDMIAHFTFPLTAQS
jgi:hypothetical protein